MQYLVRHFGTFLAALVAILFVLGAVQSFTLVSTAQPSLRAHITFTDIVNSSLGASLVPLFLSPYLIIWYLVVRCSRYHKERWIASVVFSAIFFLLNLGFMSFMDFNGIVLLMITFGTLISIISVLVGCLAHYNKDNLDSILDMKAFLHAVHQKLPELAPVLLLPPLAIAWVAAPAAYSARTAIECEQPHTVNLAFEEAPEVEIRDVRTGERAGKRSEERPLCLIMSLERGMIFFDKNAGSFLFLSRPQIESISSQAIPKAMEGSGMKR
jgi:hypothetical protein